MIRKALLATALFSSFTMAASDGALTAFETEATLEMAANVQSLISVTHVGDVSFGLLYPGNNVFAGQTYTQTESICVYTNANGFELEIDADGVGDNGFAAIGLGLFDFLPYKVDVRLGQWDDGPNSFNYTDVATNVQPRQTVSGLSYDSTFYNDTDCNSSETLAENIEIVFSLEGDDLMSATPDDYRSTVRITARTTNGEFGG